jgi:hypothetical protein
LPMEKSSFFGIILIYHITAYLRLQEALVRQKALAFLSSLGYNQKKPKRRK